MTKVLTRKSKMPSTPEHDEIIRRLSDPDYEATRLPSQLAPLSERTKWNLSQAIVQFMVEKKLTQVQMAEQLKEDRSIVNKIVRGRLEGFSIDRLTNLVERLFPKAEIQLKKTGTHG